MTVTGRRRDGDSVLSAFRCLGVGLAFGADVSKGIGTGNTFVATQQPCLRLSVPGEDAVVVALLCVEGKLLLANSHFVSSVTSLLVLFFYLPPVLEVSRSPLEKALF